MKPELKISVGIPTFNDRETVGDLLVGILKQERNGFELSEVIVVNDGSTDGTGDVCEEIAESSDPIRVIHLLKNEGKANALNMIFKEAEGEVLLLFDADCAINDNKLIAKLIKPFRCRKRLGLVSGWFRHRRSKKPNWIERRYFFHNSALLKFNNENKTFLAASGRIMAISKNLFSRVHIPRKTIGTDAFLYFYCLNEGFGFLFNGNALVDTVLRARHFSDMIKYRKRAIESYHDKTLRFGLMANKEFEKAVSLFLKHCLKECVENPVEGINFILIELIALVLTMFSRKKITFLWRR